MSTNTPNSETPDDRLDVATRRRLGRLRSMPVDTSRVEAALRGQIEVPAERRATGGARVYAMFRSMRAVAASAAVLFLVISVLLYTLTAPVSASAQTMAQLHEDLVAGRTPVVRVDSIAAANRELAAQWPESPGLPAVPEEHAMACCMKSVHNKHIACVLLDGDSPSAVSLMVANASDIKVPDSPMVVRGGVSYHTHSTGRLNMVSAVRDGRYVCLVGAVPTDRLIDLAAQLKF